MCARQPPRLALARPGQTEVLRLAAICFQVVAHRLLEHIPVDLAIGKGIGGNGFEGVQAVLVEGEGGAEIGVRSIGNQNHLTAKGASSIIR